MSDIDFAQFLKSPIGHSKYFTWSEALYLNRWNIHAMPQNIGIYNSIKSTSVRLDIARDFIGAEFNVTSWYRPQSYNSHIGGAKRSSHMFGLAVDFTVKNIDADQVRKLLLPKLSEFGIRMENLSGSNWVHIDTNCSEDLSNDLRYFSP